CAIMNSFPSWNSHLQQQYITPPTCFTNPPNQHVYPYEQQCQSQFGYEACQAQGYASCEGSQEENTDLLEQIQKME
ncbi:hypothetical protein KI387_011288, partial [Taxus chinensis]